MPPPSWRLRSELEVGGRQGTGRDAGDLDLDVDDAVPIGVQLEDRAARAVGYTDHVTGRIEAVVGVELESLIARDAAVGVDTFQNNEIAAGRAGALEAAGDDVTDAGADSRI